ncbi:MAG: hypothetical protein HXL33_03245 [Prevotellaceae bacterium]|nr:hypothetical protein [Prevotellaceae bacterium]
MSLCNNMVSFTVYSSWYGDRQQRIRQLSHDVYGGRQQRCRRPPYYEQNSINNHTWPHNHYNCMVKSWKLYEINGKTTSCRTTAGA